jgi:hypothetical protein
MVKYSPEHLSGRLYKAGFNPPKPPADLGGPECDLWKSIVEGLPPDWFNAASLRLLTRFVRTAIYAELVHDALNSEAVGSPEAADLLKQVIAVNGSCGNLAAKLRLSTQVTMTARSTGRMNERRSSFNDDELLTPGLIGLRQ